MIDFPLEFGEDIREIEGFSNYCVTSFGRVVVGPNHRHPDCLLLSMVPNRRGYLKVTPFREGRQYNRDVHRLVAEAFIPNPSRLPTVNHIRGEEKWNNRVWNLEWATQRRQIHHALETGLWGLSENWGISYNPSLKDHNKPYRLRFSTPDFPAKSYGVYSSKLEARQARDKICEEQGLTRLIREA